MPDENPILDPLQRYETMEREIVYLLTDPDEHPPIWSVADIGRQMETDDPMAVLRPLRTPASFTAPQTGSCSLRPLLTAWSGWSAASPKRTLWAPRRRAGRGAR